MWPKHGDMNGEAICKWCWSCNVLYVFQHPTWNQLRAPPSEIKSIIIEEVRDSAFRYVTGDLPLDDWFKLNCPVTRLQICPLYMFGNNPPQMVPMDLNIGETRVWWLDSGPNLQPWVISNPKFHCHVTWSTTSSSKRSFNEGITNSIPCIPFLLRRSHRMVVNTLWYIL